MNERRRDRRHPVELPVTMKVGKKSFSGTTVNVSFKGLRVKADDLPTVRQLVQLEMLLGSDSFSAHAMVVHAGTGAVGLEFFGRTNNPAWDEFVQGLARQPTGGTPAAGVPIAPTTNPNVQVPAYAAAHGSVRPPGPQITPAAGTNISVAPPRLGRRTGGAPYAGPERRRAPRIAMQLELRLRTTRSIHTAYTTDVSMLSAGVLLSELTSPPGEPVILNLIQPGTNFSFRRDGVIKRVSPVDATWTHVGIEFTPLEPMREVLFADFMNSAYATLQAKGP
jgi:hypothetical protein